MGRGFTNEVISTDVVHQRIHQGIMFGATVYDAALANAADLELLLQVGAGVAHARLVGRIGGDGELRLFEGTTFSSAGSAVASVNRNRTKSITSTVTVTSAPTITDDGTELETQLIPGGSGFLLSGGGEGPVFEEVILAPSTNYLLRLTNISGGNQPANLAVDYYLPQGV